MEDRISERQKEFLVFLKDFRTRHGKAPTFREIALGMGISSKGSVSAMMQSLEKLGQIDRSYRTYRGVRVRRPIQMAG